MRTGETERDSVAALRAETWALQETLHRVTNHKGARNCGRRPTGGGVTVAGGRGAAELRGLQTCASVHLCPVCAGRIRSRRADELDAYATAWEERGGGIVLVTLTMRHFARQTLKTLVRAQSGAWRSAIGSAGRPWRRIQEQFGVVGYVRAWEVTHGANGWHPHYHVVLFLEQPWDVDRAEEFRAALYARWERALARAGGYQVSADRAVRVDLPTHGTGGQVARYLMKRTDGRVTVRVGAEMTRADAKKGRSGRRTPFEILGDIRDQLASAQEGTEISRLADVRLWRQYEEGSHGVRALHWSTGMEDRLAALVDLDQATDEEIAAEVEEELEPVAVIPSETWYRHVVGVPGRRVALVEAVERNGLPALKRLIKQWGLVWGVDVLPPTDPAYADEAAALEDLRRELAAGGRAQERADRRAEVRAAAAARTVTAEARQRRSERFNAQRAAVETGGAGSGAQGPSQGVLLPERLHVPDLAVLEEMTRAFRARNGAAAEAGIARLRKRGLLAPLTEEPPVS